MARKRFVLGFLVLTVIAILWVFNPSPAQAQCGDTPPDSSCFVCHESAGAYPVYEQGEWHAIHALKDCCWNCHGGNARVLEEDLAHEGMTAHPLQDIYTDCYSCHPADYAQRAARFAIALSVSPSSVATPTAVIAAPVQTIPIIVLPTPVASLSGQLPWQAILLGISALGTLLLALAFAGLSKFLTS